MRWLVFYLLLLFSAGNAQAQSCSGTPNANTNCSGPSSGGAGFPSFRSMVTADIAPAGTLPNPFSAGTSLYPGSIGTNGRYDQNSAFIANTLGSENAVIGLPGASTQGGTPTWLNTYLGGVDTACSSTTGCASLNIVSPNGYYGVAVGTRSGDQANLTPVNVIASSAIAQHTNTTVAHLTWAGYDVVVAASGALASHQIGREIDTHNLGSAAPAQDPFTINPSSSIETLRLANGIPGIGSPTRSSSYLVMTNNASTAASAMIVANGALDTGSGNANPDALAMPNAYSLSWYNAAAAKTWQMFAGSGANGNLNLTTGGSGLFSVTGGESVSGALSAGSISTSGTLGAGATTVTSLTESTGLAYNTSFTPVLSCGAGTITTSTPTARYRQLGKTIHVLLNLSITTLGTCATTISATLPFTAGTIGAIGSGRDTGVGGKMLSATVNGGSATAQIFNYDNTFPAASGSNFIITIAYERN